MKIAITGGSGFIGTELTRKLIASGHEVLVLDLLPPKFTHSNVTFHKTNLTTEGFPKELSECEAIIHLAGVNIFGKWTEEYKKLILSSRVNSARAIIDFLKNNPHKIKAFISASAVGYYGDTGESATDETGANGNDFLAKVCKEWESAVREAEVLGVRTVSIRTGIALGKNGGMLQKLFPVFSWGLGGKIGSGKQWFSWISIHDLVRVYEFAVTNHTLTGAVNAVSPSPVRNSELTRTLGEKLHRPTLFPVPVFLLRFALGELANALVQNSRVVPKKLLDAGFVFEDPTLAQALGRL
jgi:uncharacterized protein (TIGR01777 family)